MLSLSSVYMLPSLAWVLGVLAVLSNKQPVPEPWTAPAGSEGQDSTFSRVPEGSYKTALAGETPCQMRSG